MKDYYKILELTATATQEEITASYKRLIKQWHPDVNKSDDAMERTKELNEAYAALSNNEKRQIYDQQHNPFDRTPGQYPQGYRFYGTPGGGSRVNITIVHTPNGTQVWVNGIRQQ